MKQSKLTVAQLKAMQPGKIFASGIVKNEPGGLYMVDNDLGRELKWVACRGQGFHDWAIYCDWADRELSDTEIHDWGQKVSLDNAQKLVSCEAEALELYRL